VTKQPDANPRTLADGIMLLTLQRAAAGKLRRGEAAQCRELMAAFEAWSNGSQRSALVEQAQEVARLGREIARQGETLPQDVLAETKALLRTAVSEAVTEALTEQLEVPTVSDKPARRRAAPGKKR
jgi:hypothetical protein